MSQESLITRQAAPRQRWLMILRLGLSLFMGGALVLLQTRGYGRGLPESWFQAGLTVVSLYFCLAVVFYLIRNAAWDSLQVASQVSTDLALAICLTLVTGGEASPLSFLFIIAIINSSFLGGPRLPLVVATFSALLWGGLITSQGVWLLAKFLPQVLAGPGLETALPLNTMLSVQLDRIVINTGASYLVAFLSGHLASQLARSHRALVASQAHLGRLSDLNEIIIQSIDSGLITTSRDGLVLTVNRPGLRILGLNQENLIGRPWTSFLPESAQALLPAAPGGGGEARGVRFKQIRPSDGRELTLELHVLALLNPSGEIWGRLFVLKDLTSLIRMEEAVRKAEHLAALGEMAAGLAHELRTPLASITGAWHMLAKEAPNPEDQRRLSGIIGREMDRLAKLTNDFLSFARPVQGAPDLLDLSALIDDHLQIFDRNTRPGLKLEKRFRPVPPVFFDRDHFSQIVWNLLNNAVEAGARQENLTIGLEIGCDPDWPNHVTFKVANDGPPIPPEDLPLLFQPFFTTKSSGHGLGLATISRLLNEGGGDITVNSDTSGLTTFSVYLPTAPARLNPA